VGWALGDGQEHGDDPAWDAAEAEALYGLLEREVVPAFYVRDERGIPLGWVARMRESMARLTPMFSSNRVVREYTEKCYLPGAAAYCQRAANHSQDGVDLLDWQRELARHWSKLRFGSITVDQRGNQHVFRVQVYLDELDPDAVQVELYADGQNGEGPVWQVMDRSEPLVGSANGFLYVASIPAVRPANHYTPRVIPCRTRASVPLEVPLILWHDPESTP
jgi:starch phosphorylase